MVLVKNSRVDLIYSIFFSILALNYFFSLKNRQMTDYSFLFVVKSNELYQVNVIYSHDQCLETLVRY